MMKAFRYKRAPNGDAFTPIWDATHRRTGEQVGQVRRAGANYYEVRRPVDTDFHSTFGLRIEASRWLKE
jgi:hypothetical protein